MTTHLEALPDAGRRILAASFPDYTGRKWRIERESGPVAVTSSWDGGSRDYFAFVRLADMAALPVPTNGNMFVGSLPAVEIPSGCVLVEHSIFCGKDHGVTFHVRADEATALLPTATEALPWAQIVVLTATASLRSSYGGVKNLRQHEAMRETGISAEDYDAAKAALIASGHLSAAGAITPRGRNAVPPLASLWRLRVVARRPGAEESAL